MTEGAPTNWLELFDRSLGYANTPTIRPHELFRTAALTSLDNIREAISRLSEIFETKTCLEILTAYYADISSPLIPNQESRFVLKEVPQDVETDEIEVIRLHSWEDVFHQATPKSGAQEVEYETRSALNLAGFAIVNLTQTQMRDLDIIVPAYLNQELKLETESGNRLVVMSEARKQSEV